MPADVLRCLCWLIPRRIFEFKTRLDANKLKLGRLAQPVFCVHSRIPSRWESHRGLHARLVLLKCAVKNCVFTRQSHTSARQKCLSVKELSDSSGVSQHTLPVVSPGLLWQRKVSGCVRWSFEVSKRSIRNDDIMAKLLCSIFRLNDVTQYTMTHTHYLWLEANVNITITWTRCICLTLLVRSS